MGDYDVNILNSDNHNENIYFTDQLYSNSFIPISIVQPGWRH